MSCGKWLICTLNEVNVKVSIVVQDLTKLPRLREQVRNDFEIDSQNLMRYPLFFSFADFIINLDRICGPLTLHSSLKDLVNYTRIGLDYLSKEPLNTSTS